MHTYIHTCVRTEPLPQDSALWTLPNVLISPHNADQTATFLHKASKCACMNGFILYIYIYTSL